MFAVSSWHHLSNNEVLCLLLVFLVQAEELMPLVNIFAGPPTGTLEPSMKLGMMLL
jgi:hypothetical protein